MLTGRDDQYPTNRETPAARRRSSPAFRARKSRRARLMQTLMCQRQHCSDAPALEQRALESQIAATEFLAPSPFASAEWGLKHAVLPSSALHGPRGASNPGTLASPPSVSDLAPHQPLTLWVSLGRAAQSWAPWNTSRRQITEAHFTLLRALGCQF